MPAFLLVLIVTTSAWGQMQLSPSGHYTFTGVTGAEDLSGVVKLTDDLLLVGSDETIFAETLKRTGATEFALDKQVKLLKKSEIILDKDGASVEIDIEGITMEDNVVYVIGSHSLKRKKVDMKKGIKRSQKKNRERLMQPVAEPSRHHLIRLAFDPATGTLERTGEKNLNKVLGKVPYLALAATIPSKENGLDIEGIAAKDGKVYVGFRGPVLRENHVPVALFDFDSSKAMKIKSTEILFVHLGGRGIRDMAAVKDGFLLIGGPVSDLGSYKLYFWNGKDAIYGKKSEGQIVPLGEIKPPQGGKAEGLAVLAETDTSIRVMMLYDSIDGGAPQVYELTKTW